MLQMKRVYEAAADSDGYRILVDRIWPRGFQKNAPKLRRGLKKLHPPLTYGSGLVMNQLSFPFLKKSILLKLLPTRIGQNSVT